MFPRHDTGPLKMVSISGAGIGDGTIFFTANAAAAGLVAFPTPCHPA